MDCLEIGVFRLAVRTFPDIARSDCILCDSGGHKGVFRKGSVFSPGKDMY